MRNLVIIIAVALLSILLLCTSSDKVEQVYIQKATNIQSTKARGLDSEDNIYSVFVLGYSDVELDAQNVFPKADYPTYPLLLVKYSPDYSTLLWKSVLLPGVSIASMSICKDDGVIITGVYTSSTTIKGRTITPDGQDSIIHKTSSDGNLEWAVSITGALPQHIYGYNENDDGTFLFHATTRGQSTTVTLVSVDNPVSQQTPSNGASYQHILFKLTASGEPVWGKILAMGYSEQKIIFYNNDVYLIDSTTQPYSVFSSDTNTNTETLTVQDKVIFILRITGSGIHSHKQIAQGPNISPSLTALHSVTINSGLVFVVALLFGQKPAITNTGMNTMVIPVDLSSTTVLAGLALNQFSELSSTSISRSDYPGGVIMRYRFFGSQTAVTILGVTVPASSAGGFDIRYVVDNTTGEGKVMNVFNVVTPATFNWGQTILTDDNYLIGTLPVGSSTVTIGSVTYSNSFLVMKVDITTGEIKWINCYDYQPIDSFMSMLNPLKSDMIIKGDQVYVPIGGFTSMTIGSDTIVSTDPFTALSLVLLSVKVSDGSLIDYTEIRNMQTGLSFLLKSSDSERLVVYGTTTTTTFGIGTYSEQTSPSTEVLILLGKTTQMCKKTYPACETCLDETTCATCHNYITNCTTCQSLNKCALCDFGYVMNQDQTACETCHDSISDCDECASASTCNKCTGSLVLSTDEKVCDTCSNYIGNCTQCSSSENCTQCDTDFFTNQDQSACETCHDSINDCEECASASTCKRCTGSLLLSKDRTTCDTCSNYIGNCSQCSSSETCEKCDTDFFTSQDGSKCETCHDSINDCDECGSADRCKKCSDGYFLTPEGSCVDRVYCFGKSSKDATACGSRGYCTATDTCTCQNGFAGYSCQRVCSHCSSNY